MINLLLLNNFYPAISSSTSSKEKESDELLRTVWSLVMVRNQLPAQVVKRLTVVPVFVYLYIYGRIII